QQRNKVRCTSCNTLRCLCRITKRERAIVFSIDAHAPRGSSCVDGRFELREGFLLFVAPQGQLGYEGFFSLFIIPRSWLIEWDSSEVTHSGLDCIACKISPMGR